MRRANTILAGGAGALAAALAVAGCGGSGGAGKEFGTFTDCGGFGKITRISDPTGDQRGRLGDAPEAGQGDLIGVRLARNGGRLCVEFEARSPIRPPAAYVLALRPRGAERPVVRLEGTVLAAADPEALLNPGGGDAFRRIDATVGVSGRRLSIVTDRRTFAALGVAPVFDGFRFQARAAVVATDGGRLTDCAPACT